MGKLSKEGLRQRRIMFKKDPQIVKAIRNKNDMSLFNALAELRADSVRKYKRRSKQMKYPEPKNSYQALIGLKMVVELSNKLDKEDMEYINKCLYFIEEEIKKEVQNERT